MLCFISSLTGIEKLMSRVDQDIPWANICSFLNVLATTSHVLTPKIWVKTLPMPSSGETQFLPEDYAMRGQLFSLWYYPVGWFEEGVQFDIEEQSLERPSMAETRIERILWLGMCIALVSTTYKTARSKPFPPFQLRSYILSLLLSLLLQLHYHSLDLSVWFAKSCQRKRWILYDEDSKEFRSLVVKRGNVSSHLV